MASLKDLIAQREALEREISQRQNQDRTEAVAKVKALMEEYGLSSADVFAKPAARKNAGKPPSKVAAKYRNTETGETWSGRGLQPRWLKAALGSGRKITDFAV